MHIHVYVCTYVCIYIYIHTCVYIYHNTTCYDALTYVMILCCVIRVMYYNVIVL